MERHDARNTGSSADEIAPPLRLLWKRILGPAERWDRLFASGGAVCTAALRNSRASWQFETRLLDSRGRNIWTVPAAQPIYLAGNTLVLEADAPRGAVIRSYNWPTRRLLWSCAIDADQRRADSRSAVMSDGWLYFAYESLRHRSVVIAVGLDNGAVKAQHEFEEGWWMGPPAVLGGQVYWGVSHWLRVLDAHTLEPQWATYEGGNAYPTPFDSKLYIRGWEHGAGAESPDGRTRLWSYGAWRDSPHCFARRTGQSRIIVESMTDPPSTAGVDAASGRVLWRDWHRVGGSAPRGSAGSGRFAYVCADDIRAIRRNQPLGGFYGYDCARGELVWRYERKSFTGYSIIVSGRRVYALGSDGALYCFAPVRRGRGSQRSGGHRP